MDDSQRLPDEAATPPVEKDASGENGQPVPTGGEEATVGTGSVIGVGCMIVVSFVICVGIAVYLVR